MAIKIGPKGYVWLHTAEASPRRQVKIVAFKGLAAAAEIPGQHFYPAASSKNLAAVIDVTNGIDASAYFRDTGSIAGDLHLTQVDTGATANHDNADMIAIYTDSGTP
ncbi:MAG TPA: hypothetical protein VMX97_02615 [Hyphomicrobiaceae bacterium]|nr:hypothetical protein [Hyphomicrobiaceae bacterium]